MIPTSMPSHRPFGTPSFFVRELLRERDFITITKRSPDDIANVYTASLSFASSISCEHESYDHPPKHSNLI